MDAPSPLHLPLSPKRGRLENVLKVHMARVSPNVLAYERAQHSLQPHPVIRPPNAAVESASAVRFGIVVGGC